MIVSAMETSARRAQMIYDTLHDQSQAGHDERAIVAQIEKLRPRFGEKDVREPVNDLEAQRASHVKLRESLSASDQHGAAERLAGPDAQPPDRDVGRRGGDDPARADRAGARDPRPHGALHAVLLETSDDAGGDDCSASSIAMPRPSAPAATGRR